MTVCDRSEFEQAHARLRRDPAALTVSDIAQLGAFSTDLAREALAARKAALFPAPAVPAAPHGPATKGGLSQGSIDAIAEGVVTFVAEQVRPILSRLEAIEQNREKGVGNVRWRGVFKQGDTFQSGELATYRGALRACQRATTQTPGRPPDTETPSDWVLIVKTGKDLG